MQYTKCQNSYTASVVCPLKNVQVCTYTCESVGELVWLNSQLLFVLQHSIDVPVPQHDHVLSTDSVLLSLLISCKFNAVRSTTILILVFFNNFRCRITPSRTVLQLKRTAICVACWLLSCVRLEAAALLAARLTRLTVCATSMSSSKTGTFSFSLNKLSNYATKILFCLKYKSSNPQIISAIVPPRWLRPRYDDFHM